MYTITKEFAFEASHRLTGLPEGHQCARLHGHSYRVVVELQSESVNSIGFVVDYGELGEFKKYLDERFDHRHLNDIVVGNPTAENLAHLFYWWCKSHWEQVSAVSVSETGKTWATYREYATA